MTPEPRGVRREELLGFVGPRVSTPFIPGRFALCSPLRWQVLEWPNLRVFVEDVVDVDHEAVIGVNARRRETANPRTPGGPQAR